jgi:hypothetical protein
LRIYYEYESKWVLRWPTHSVEHFFGVVSVGESRLEESCVDFEPSVAHQLLSGVTRYLRQFHFVGFVELRLPFDEHSFGWSVQPLFRSRHLWSERVILHCFSEFFFFLNLQLSEQFFLLQPFFDLSLLQ